MTIVNGNLRGNVTGEPEIEIVNIVSGLLRGNVQGEPDQQTAGIDGALVGNVSGEPDVFISTVAGVLTGDVAGDTSQLVLPQTDGQLTGDIVGFPELQGLALTDGVLFGSVGGEPESDVDERTQRVIRDGFSTQITLTTQTGLALDFAYTDGDQPEDLNRRFTKTQTLDTGVHFYDGGFSHGDRTMRLDIEGATRLQVDTAKAILQAGRVQVAFWEGIFEGYLTLLEVRGETITVDVEITRKVSD